MFQKKDVQAWIAEVQEHPASAVDLIRMLATRLEFLDRQNEELRADLIRLRRNPPGNDNHALKQRIDELENALKTKNDAIAARRLLIYTSEQLEANLDLPATVTGREVAALAKLLTYDPSARLIAVTSESRVFGLSANQLPIPEGESMALGTPDPLATFIEQSTLDRSRFVIVLTTQGYMYSQLAGALLSMARQQGKLIQNLRPGDSVLDVVPSNTPDIVALSAKGRWIRFSEKLLTAQGNLAMKLAEGDRVIQVLPMIEKSTFTFLTTDGRLFVRPASDFNANKMPGSPGSILFKNASVLGASTAEEMIILTQQGNLLSINTQSLPYRAQTDSGLPVPGLTPTDPVVALTSLRG